MRRELDPSLEKSGSQAINDLCMNRKSRSHVAVKELARRVWKEMDADNVTDLAAQASYYSQTVRIVTRFWRTRLKPVAGSSARSASNCSALPTLPGFTPQR